MYQICYLVDIFFFQDFLISFGIMSTSCMRRFVTLLILNGRCHVSMDQPCPSDGILLLCGLAHVTRMKFLRLTHWCTDTC